MVKLNWLISKIWEHVRAFWCYPLAWIIARCLPLKDNKYFCISMSGNSYGDNIKYLAEYISRHNKDATIVWAFTSEFFYKADCPFQSVKLYTFQYYYHILTSKYILSNARLNQRMLHKRKGQIYLNTWHGTALKRLGTDVKERESNRLQQWLKPSVFQFDVQNTDIMISGSRFMSEIFRDKFLFKGRIEETGTPRNDIFFYSHPEIAQKVRSRYQIDGETQIILYAPTFRSDGLFTYYDIDGEQLLSQWQKKTGKKCVLMVRLHPNLQYKSRDFISRFPQGTINASDYPDMQELLYTTDLLVTDYSSSMFDFMYTYKPVIMYVPDSQEYDRGFYFNLEDLPFMVINDNSLIKKVILEFDRYQYRIQVDSFNQKIGSVERGNSSKQIYEMLIKTK